MSVPTTAPRSRRAADRPSRRLPDAVHDGARTYRLVRAWPRGTEHALVELAAEDGATVAGQWFADPAALASGAAATPAPARVAGDVLLQPGGADARLRALGGVLAEDGARLVAHRPGRRAVVRLDAPDGTVREFAKVVRGSRASDLARRGSLVAELVGGAVPVPRLLDTGEVGRGVLRWSVVPGRTLHDLGAGRWEPEAARTAWEAAGRAVRHLHDAPRGRVTARHGATDELGAVADWLHPAVVHGLLDARLVARAGERVAAELDAGAGDSALGVLHRDLHDKQLLLDDAGTVGMIDVDTLAVGERALDVANLLVHLELREAQGVLTPGLAAAARDGFLSGVGAGELPHSRVAAYARATRLRLAGVYAFRPRWRSVAQELLAQAAG
ncbi:aminoglycoside phosphotransferase family protein [Oceanitalea stevensii]|uniref:Aminoglycoside phosphotransferase family protein n=1 Tax=Oceanitalea stevensii TaxID=2763072 RepID=A0ABR8Z6J4_9MICO|nr:aminoglycoside phosphotransferase family protein [Oceanitalea stevensii]MBD8063541.1 aminoglycoside phosphotransferase family protein [Oceanitalea stevensii]